MTRSQSHIHLKPHSVNLWSGKMCREFSLSLFLSLSLSLSFSPFLAFSVFLSLSLSLSPSLSPLPLFLCLSLSLSPSSPLPRSPLVSADDAVRLQSHIG